MKLSSKIVLAVSPLALLTAGGWILWIRSDIHKYASSLPEQIRLAEQAGMIMSPKAIGQSLERPGERNAAPYYVIAVPLMEGNSNETKTLIDSDDWAGIERLVKEEQPSIIKVRELSKFPYINFERDWEHGWNISFRELGPMRSATVKLDLEAQLLAHQGKMAAAIEDLKTSLRVADQVAVEPILIAALISLPIKVQVLKSIRRIAAEHHDEDTLAKLRAIAAAIRLPDMHGAVQCEAIWSAQAFANMGDQSGMLVDGQNPLPLARFKSVRDAYASRGIEEYRKLYEELPKDPEQVDKVREAMEAIDLRMQSTDSSMKGIAVVAPGFSPTGKVITDLAAERELTLAFLDEFGNSSRLLSHIDPWSGKPFLRNPTAEFYSVGQDKKDDKGQNDDLASSPTFKKSFQGPTI